MKDLKKTNSKFSKYIKFALTIFIFIFTQSLIIKIFNLNYNNFSKNQLIIFDLVSTSIEAILIYLLYRKEVNDEFKLFWKKKNDCFDVGFRFWCLGLIIMGVSNILISSIFPIENASNQTTINAMIKINPFLMMLDTSILAPICEELIFRKSFRTIIKNDVLYILISGLVFGSLHVIGYSNIAWYEYLYIIPYSSLGICFAYIYVKTKTITTTIVMHAIHNVLITALSIIALTGMIIW